MQRLARTVSVAVALTAAAVAVERRDWLITNQLVPRAPDLLSLELTPPPLDFATTQVAPGQWIYLPRSPRPIPRAERGPARSGLRGWFDAPGIGRHGDFGSDD